MSGLFGTAPPESIAAALQALTTRACLCCGAEARGERCEACILEGVTYDASPATAEERERIARIGGGR